MLFENPVVNPFLEKHRLCAFTAEITESSISWGSVSATKQATAVFNHLRLLNGLKDVPLLWLTPVSKEADGVWHKGCIDEMIDYPPSLSFVSALTLSLYVCLRLSCVTAKTENASSRDPCQPKSSYLFRQVPNSPLLSPISSGLFAVSLLIAHMEFVAPFMQSSNSSFSSPIPSSTL